MRASPMVLFNYSTKELTAKVVYYGPGLCGKTTNLQWIHEKLPVKNKGKMLSLATETDRTLFFDFLPIEIGTVRGMRTRIQLYTVPGQVFYNATRRMVLKGADAVVFVCDSQEAMLEPNLESFENMRQNLEANEIDPDEIPIVLQYNKRDLPNALPIEILDEHMNPRNLPFHEAIAVTGVGVEDTLKTVTKLVFKSLSARYGDGASAATSPGFGSRAPRPIASGSEAARGAAQGSGDDLLRALAQPPFLTPPPPAQGGLPLIELEPTPAPGTPAVAPTVGVPERPPAPATIGLAAQSSNVPTRPPVPPPPPPPRPPGAPPPQDTLIARRDEAFEMRRGIIAPGIPDDMEMELEEFEDLEAEEPPPLAPAVPRAPQAPSPAPSAAALSAAEARSITVALEAPLAAREVEVPIEVELAPGATKLQLTLRLLLTLKRR
jgi:signal recognition particle receptor subunit beta